jgi:hypothetical protein
MIPVIPVLCVNKTRHCTSTENTRGPAVPYTINPPMSITNMAAVNNIGERIELHFPIL